ncbi:hypothetical protein DRF69_16545 [Chryseobacterium sp. 5_R23647]|nr:hypothetical protein DRF69_16545 [Chryseobacterium sp. 5_R23647]
MEQIVWKARLFIVPFLLFFKGIHECFAFRTCDLPRPRRVNNHRYLYSFADSLQNSFPRDSRIGNFP